MCSGRVDLSFVLRAFLNGMDGVFIGGCHLNECHYITDGNHHAYAMVQICKKLLGHIGVNPERLRIEQVSAGEGIRFAEVMNDFSRKIRELGRLGKAEGIEEETLKFRLTAATGLIPYIRLVERERLRIRLNSVEEYAEYFSTDEVNKLFRELIADFSRRGRTILFSTHVMEHAEKLCDRIALIARGRVVLSGELAAIKRERGGNVWRVAGHGDLAGAAQGLAGVERVLAAGEGAVRLVLADPAAAPRVLAALAGAVEVTEFRSEEPDLETIFVRTVHDAN